MARERQPNGEGLSLETLLVAAIASAVAAIVVSRFWQGGTPIAAAVTPVIVALVSEALRRPMQSELVRRPVRRAAELRATPIRRYRTGERPVVTEEPPPQGDRHERATEPVMPAYNVYRAEPDGKPGLRERLSGWRERLSRRRVKIALVTGLLGFLLAALVITVPELLFGGSVTGTERDTTFFGGGGDDGNGRDGDRDGGGGQPDREPPAPDTPSGSAPQPGDGGGDAGDQPPSEEPPPQDTSPSPAPPLPQPPPETTPTP